jgi:hypothetical protein
MPAELCHRMHMPIHTLLISLLIGPSALASHLDTPECRRDSAVAGQLVEEGIAKREGSVKPGDAAGACRLLRRNLPEMIKARNAMDRCLTGHDHGENVWVPSLSPGWVPSGRGGFRGWGPRKDGRAPNEQRSACGFAIASVQRLIASAETTGPYPCLR